MARNTLSKSEQSFARFFTDDEIKIIQDFVDENIIGEQSMTAKQLSAAINDKSARHIPESTFCNALSCTVRAGRITGIQGRRRKGYVRVDETPEESSSSEEKGQVEEPKANLPAAPKAAPLKPKIPIRYRHVWVKRTLYRVPMLTRDIKKLITGVLHGKQEQGGTVVFEGVEHNVPDEKLLERFFGFNGAIECGESDPILDDGSGVPIELRIME